MPPLLSLVGDGSAPPRDPRQTGLYHFAILVPTRRDLAVALVRLAQGGWQLDGASDHLVSEALYLSDPDGNGIEIYRDRPRAEWRRGPDGQLSMATLPLDLDDLLGELQTAPVDPVGDAQMPDGTRIGHVHLQVAELEQTEAFYAGVLGFDVMVRGYPGALFVAAGGYHHHVGLNTWHSRGGSTPPSGGIGLRAYELKLGDCRGARRRDRPRRRGRHRIGAGRGRSAIGSRSERQRRTAHGLSRPDRSAQPPLDR